MGFAQLVGNKNWQKDASSCASFAAMCVTVQITIRVSFQSFSPQKSSIRHLANATGACSCRANAVRKVTRRSGDRPKIHDVESGVRTAFLTGSIDPRRGRNASNSAGGQHLQKTIWLKAVSKA
jgi:hypothetical protein